MEKLPKLLETLLAYFARGNQQRNPELIEGDVQRL